MSATAETTEAARALVAREGSLRIYRYAATAARRTAPPVVLVYSWINRPTVLDLLPERSVVRSLLAAGLDVFLVDWGNPGRDEAGLDLDAHVARLERAVRRAAEEAGATRASLLGYCLGGVAALLLAERAPSLVAGVALLATPVVFERGGMLRDWANAPGFDPACLARTESGNVPGEVLREMFRWLDPIAQLKKWVTLAERAGDDAFVEGFLAHERWANGCVDFPGKLYAELLVNLYREDRLAKGTLELGGRRVSLAGLVPPVLSVVAEGDGIVPEGASLPLAELVGTGRVQTLRVPGGHIGMTVGRRAPETTHKSLASFLGGVA